MVINKVVYEVPPVVGILNGGGLLTGLKFNPSPYGSSGYFILYEMEKSKNEPLTV